jgi:hypothetical protein
MSESTPTGPNDPKFQEPTPEEAAQAEQERDAQQADGENPDQSTRPTDSDEPQP